MEQLAKIYDNMPSSPFTISNFAPATPDQDRVRETLDQGRFAANSSDMLSNIIEDENVGNDKKVGNIKNDKRIIQLNKQINIAKGNIENNTGLLNKGDEDTINELRSALRDTFTNSKFMLQKIIKKNGFIGDDYNGVGEQIKNLEELNQIYNDILIKYK